MMGLIVLSFPIFALNHNGTIGSNETWYAGDNPHIITGDLNISDGVTLTVEAGCNVKFGGPHTMLVYGVLEADGSSGNHITFTSNQAIPAPGDWDYIYFISADAGCVLDYCDISYGGTNYGSVLVYNSGSNVAITNCTIEQSGSSGIYVHDNSSPTISGCTIQDNSTMGIYCYHSHSYPYISDCSILNNGSYAIRTYPDNLKEITGTMTITGNTYNSILVISATAYNGTWLDHNVPYVIGGNITVADQDTLYIDPGCELRFNGNYTFDVQGALVAAGTAGNHIIFTSNLEPQAPGDWQYIYFNSADAGCLLEYCDISYGGSTDGNIRFYYSYSNVTVSNCVIEESGTTGFSVINNSSPTITGCVIQDNTTHGIHCSNGTAYPYISDCSILNNGSYAIVNYANDVKEITGTMTITGNTYNSIKVNSESVNTGT